MLRYSVTFIHKQLMKAIQLKGSRAYVFSLVAISSMLFLNGCGIKSHSTNPFRPSTLPGTPPQALNAGAQELTLESVLPPEGRFDMSTPVSLHGSGFLPNAQVFFNQVPCREIRWISSELMHCKAPPSSASLRTHHKVDVKILNSNGEMFTKKEAFLYLADWPLFHSPGQSPDFSYMSSSPGDSSFSQTHYSYAPGHSGFNSSFASPVSYAWPISPILAPQELSTPRSRTGVVPLPPPGLSRSVSIDSVWSDRTAETEPSPLFHPQSVVRFRPSDPIFEPYDDSEAEALRINYLARSSNRGRAIEAVVIGKVEQVNLFAPPDILLNGYIINQPSLAARLAIRPGGFISFETFEVLHRDLQRDISLAAESGKQIFAVVGDGISPREIPAVIVCEDEINPDFHPRNIPEAQDNYIRELIERINQRLEALDDASTNGIYSHPSARSSGVGVYLQPARSIFSRILKAIEGNDETEFYQSMVEFATLFYRNGPSREGNSLSQSLTITLNDSTVLASETVAPLPSDSSTNEPVANPSNGGGPSLLRESYHNPVALQPSLPPREELSEETESYRTATPIISRTTEVSTPNPTTPPFPPRSSTAPSPQHDSSPSRPLTASPLDRTPVLNSSLDTTLGLSSMEQSFESSGTTSQLDTSVFLNRSFSERGHDLSQIRRSTIEAFTTLFVTKKFPSQGVRDLYLYLILRAGIIN